MRLTLSRAELATLEGLLRLLVGRNPVEILRPDAPWYAVVASVAELSVKVTARYQRLLWFAPGQDAERPVAVRLTRVQGVALYAALTTDCAGQVPLFGSGPADAGLVVYGAGSFEWAFGRSLADTLHRAYFV